MDTFSYNQNADGTITKTVVHTEILVDPKEELRVLSAQLADMVAGGGDIDSIVTNYKIAIQSLSSVAPTIIKSKGI